MPVIIEHPEQAPELIALYGPPGGGKTHLATSLPWGPKWGERAIYVPIDPRAEGLKSVAPENRGRLIVVKPSTKLVNNELVLDMNDELVSIFTRDWKKEYPDVGTIICDTITVGAQEVLMAVTESASFSDKHITYGKGRAQLSIPMQGDYGAAQAVVRRWFIFLKNQPLNVLALFHGDYVEPESGEPGTLFGGPTTVGKAGVRDMAAKFDNLFFVNPVAETVTKPGSPPQKRLRYMVHTQRRGIWEAKLRVGSKNPMPEVDITDNARSFWEKFDQLT
jgi:AAA domain-containing protein